MHSAVYLHSLDMHRTGILPPFVLACHRSPPGLCIPLRSRLIRLPCCAEVMKVKCALRQKTGQVKLEELPEETSVELARMYARN